MKGARLTHLYPSLKTRTLRFVEVKVREAVDPELLNPELSASHIFTLNHNHILGYFRASLARMRGWGMCMEALFSPLGSSIREIFQARILEWVAIPSAGDLPDPGSKPVSPTWQEDSLPLSHLGSPHGGGGGGYSEYF